MRKHIFLFLSLFLLCSMFVQAVYADDDNRYCLSSENERAVFLDMSYRSSYLYEPVYVFIWDGSGNLLCGDWPGMDATALGGAQYKFVVPDETGEIDDTWQIIWNGGSGSWQTVDLPFVNHSVYQLNGRNGEDEKYTADYSTGVTSVCGVNYEQLCLSSEEERTVFFAAPYGWEESVNVYMWYGEGYELTGSWPGTPAQNIGNGYYKFVVPEEVGEIEDTWKIIWNYRYYVSGYGGELYYQTDDQDFVNHAVYDARNASPEDMESGGHRWNVDKTTITAICSGDDSNNQFCLGLEDERAVFFEKPDYWGEVVNAYIWSDEGQITGAWPGMPAVDFGNGTYKCVVPDEAAEIDGSWNIIWNDVAENSAHYQTDDLKYMNHRVYNENGIRYDISVTNHCEPQQDLVLKDNKRASYYTALAEDYNGKTLNSVTLNRQFKEGQWATLCMPFNVNQAQMRAQGLYGHVFEFRYAEKKDGESVVLYFSTAKSIQAGKGYIVSANSKLAEKSSFIFQNVTIDMSVDEASEHNIVNQSGYNDASGRSILSLVGTLRTGLLQGTEGDNVYLGLKNNQLYYPNTSEGTEIRAYRGFFRSNEPLNMQRVRIVMEETAE
ncbi:MAG: starch-binding protein [Paludibacteraceae bacterium]|nr:starch-binding protein [Paludibacteraceae bacterium]